MHNNEYLIHYGVPGMKWGVRHDKPSDSNNRFERTKWNRRAVMKARKDYKKSKNRNPEEINKIKSENIKRMHRVTTNKGMYAAAAKGKNAILTKKLLQAGYSEKSAKAGAEYMQKIGWNMDWSDGNDYARMKK